MNINMNSIMRKVDAWTKTPEGKRRIKEYIEKCKKEGRTVTLAGSKIMSEEMMAEAASKFVNVLRSVARSMIEQNDMPESIWRHFETLDYSDPYKRQDGHMEITVYFGDYYEDYLRRESLMPDRYGGINNIIALLNNGYDRHESMERVWGVWHGMRVHALTERSGLHFIQQAVDEFNGNYGADYNVMATAGDAYW